MNAKKTPFFASLLLALSLSGHVVANEARHDHAAPVAKMTPSQQVVPVPVAARFDLKVNQTQTDWYLWREADSIETASAAVGQNDIWRRVRGNEYNYRRVFHNDQRVVDYTSGEIKTRHAEPDWSKLASVISPQLLRELKRGASKTLFGEKAVRYTGKLGGQTVDLWWLEKSQLPASLQMARTGQRMTLTLKELHSTAPAAWPRATEERIADYGLIDAADFGDMESDPFVARILRQDGHSHSH
ncbi:MAG: hypothetical protein CVU33_00120 [Betaproteobacteria bacterium HGW-Betaproteobacteria-6]|nr:MAG: hypothetical protein CVU33_00120 [Betaproteobacteria bacterium HGW-Betaproteobacteria-6]